MERTTRKPYAFQNQSRRDLLRAAVAAGVSGMSSAALPWLGGAGEGQTAAAGVRPNLILFFPDELRADALGCQGNPIARTPNMDKLAREGARFGNCNVQFTVCGASRCSLLTGWPTSVHGHRSLYYFLRPDEPNMFRYLKHAGYDVFWLGKNDALAPQTFADSVTEWHDVPNPVSPPVSNANGPVTMLIPGHVDRRATNDFALLQAAIRLLERREADRPFCIFLALFQPHPPYSAPQGFDSLYNPSDLPPLIRPGAPRKPAYHSALRAAYRLTEVSDADLRKVRAMYYGQVSYSDWLLGELLQALERTGRATDTAVFLSSDHGDYAGDYGLIEKWPSGLESCLTHVPLIARIPGGTSGSVCREMVELFDIMPTLLELAGTRATHTHFARSLLPQLHGARGDPDRAAFSEGGYNIYEPQAFEPRLEGLYGPKTRLQSDHPDTVSRCASLKTTRYSFVARPGGQSELYDRSSDPGENQNLIDDRAHADILHALQGRLMSWYINTTGVPPPDKDPRETPPFYPTPELPRDPSAEARILDTPG
jgi:arylsulfatase A-like enzyme